MYRRIALWVAALAACGVFGSACGESSAEQSQAAAGGAAPPVSMTTAGTAAIPAAGSGGQVATPAAGSGGSTASVAPPSAAGAGGAAPASGSGGSAGQAAPSNDRLPCDVQSLVGRQCLSCHGSPTNLGAPMMLVTYADFHRAAASDPSQKVYQLVATRVLDTQRPMPPRMNGKLAVQDQKILADWSSQGAPPLPATAADCGK